MTIDGARFKKCARLLRPAEFSRVFDKAIRSSDSLFTLLAAANKSALPRLGLAISKKNAHRAVDRNRIKRIVRESFRQCQATLPNTDFVVLAKKGTRLATNAALFSSLNKHWEKLRCEKSLLD